MTLQSVGGLPIVYPGLNDSGTGAGPALGGGTTLDAAGEYFAIVFCASEDLVISHVGFKCFSATGTPTADVRIETVDPATGFPSGTLWGTNTNLVTGTLTTTFTLHALTASASISKGQLFAAKIVYNSGTSLQFTNIAGPINQMGVPYSVTNISGSAVKISSTVAYDLALGSGTTTFYPVRHVYPAASFAANAFNNTSSARRGLRFQVPFKCQVAGFRYYMGTAVGDFGAAIYDDSGNELSTSSTAFEGDIHSAAASSIVELFFDNPVTLDPGTWYRLAIEPASATNCNMYTATLPDANYRAAWPWGVNAHYTTYTSGGGWVDTATDQVPFLDLVIKQFSDDVGSGAVAHVIGS